MYVHTVYECIVYIAIMRTNYSYVHGTEMLTCTASYICTNVAIVVRVHNMNTQILCSM